jgi:hypothetical protein
VCGYWNKNVLVHIFPNECTADKFYIARFEVLAVILLRTEFWVVIWHNLVHGSQQFKGF